MNEILNDGNETLSEIVNGRVYPRYKEYIKKNNINVGKLVMKSLDEIDETLKAENQRGNN